MQSIVNFYEQVDRFWQILKTFSSLTYIHILWQNDQTSAVEEIKIKNTYDTKNVL